jgi:hypothetical protein
MTKAIRALLGCAFWACAVVAAFAPGTLPEAASLESCIQCQHADCMLGLAEQKEKFAAGYDKLATKWDKLVLKEGQPIDTIDYRGFNTPADMSLFYRGLNEKHAAFDRQVDEMASEIGPPQGCNYSGPKEISTDSFTKCTTDQASIKAAQEAAPCKEVARLLDDHEGLHRQACVTRLNNGAWNYTVSNNGVTLSSVVPNVMLTPAGKAREEAAAYRMEAAKFRDLYQKAKKKCKHARAELTGDAERQQRLAERERLQQASDRVTKYAASIS